MDRRCWVPLAMLLVAACTDGDEAASTTTTAPVIETTTDQPQPSMTTSTRPLALGSSTGFSVTSKEVGSSGSLLTDVRIARQTGVDPIVFEFEGPPRVSDGTTFVVASLVLTCDFEGEVFATVPLER